jgi:hypothetical protein
MPMGTVLGGSAGYPPLPPPQTELPPPAAPPEQTGAAPASPGAPPPDPFEDWKLERPAAHGHELGPVVGQQGPLPDLGATPTPPPAQASDDDWSARFGQLAAQFDEPEPPAAEPGIPPGPAAAVPLPPAHPGGPPPDEPWAAAPGTPDEPPPDAEDRPIWAGPLDQPDPADRPGGPPQERPWRGDWTAIQTGNQPTPGGQPQDRPWTGAQTGNQPTPDDRPWAGGTADRGEGEAFGRPYGQLPPPAGPQPGPTGPVRTGADRGDTPRAATRQAGTRSHRGRPEDPRQAAVYDALAINEQVLDEVWTSPSVDVLKVVSSIVVNALDAYEDDPAEYADWVAVHRTGNCDCH